MTEQGSGWGMTVSRRFNGAEDADSAVGSLRQAGFREDEIRVWQQRQSPGASGEDGLARVVEGILGGGVIGGLAGFFVTIAFTWTDSQRITEETSAAGALGGAIAGAIIVGLLVSILSRRYSFGHSHEHDSEPASVVTVMVGDREDEAKQVFDKLG